MAEITKDIDTGGLGDYASLNVWESTEQQDLTDGGGDWMHATNRASGDAADTIATTINGWILAEFNYILIDAAAGEEALKTGWSDTRCRLATIDANPTLTIADNYVRLKRLQIKNSGLTVDRTAVLISFTETADIRIDSCRIVGDPADSGTGLKLIHINDSDATMNIYNSILAFAADPADGNSRGVEVQDAAAVNIYNCVLNNCYFGVLRSAGTVTVKNSAVFQHTDDFSGTITADYNASDDNDGTNNVAESGGGADWPDDFVDAAVGDVTLKATSNLKWAGTPDPGSGLFSTDMEGDAYEDPPSLGVDEIVAGGETHQMAGVVASASALTGAINLEKSIAGAVASVSALSGAVNLEKQIAGSIDSVSALSGGVNLKKTFSGTVAGISTLSGATNLTKTIAGVVASVSAITGVIQQTLSIGGQVASVSTLSGAVELTARLAGTIAGVSSVSGSVNLLKALAGAIDAISALLGTLTLEGAGRFEVIELLGSLTKISTTLGALSKTATVDGALTKAVELTGQLRD